LGWRSIRHSIPPTVKLGELSTSSVCVDREVTFHVYAPLAPRERAPAPALLAAIVTAALSALAARPQTLSVHPARAVQEVRDQ